jgi:Resolvase, N terminal domain
MVWSLDRLGRSLLALLQTVEHLHRLGMDIYLDQQHLDTTTAAGKLLFHITGAFGEFERSAIRERVKVSTRLALFSVGVFWEKLLFSGFERVRPSSTALVVNFTAASVLEQFPRRALRCIELINQR